MIVGPSCPSCGCPESRVVDRRARWGGNSSERRVCAHCGRRWLDQVAARPEPSEPTGPAPAPDTTAIYWVAVAPSCPECGSDDTLVIQTTRPIRRHKCRGCESTFKSIERRPTG